MGSCFALSLRAGKLPPGFSFFTYVNIFDLLSIQSFWLESKYSFFISLLWVILGDFIILRRQSYFLNFSILEGCFLFPWGVHCSSMKITMAFSMRYPGKQEINLGIFSSYLLLCNKPAPNAMVLKQQQFIIYYHSVSWLVLYEWLFQYVWHWLRSLIWLHSAASWISWKFQEVFTYVSGLPLTTIWPLQLTKLSFIIGCWSKRSW